jgi:hypothetical protein
VTLPHADLGETLPSHDSPAPLEACGLRQGTRCLCVCHAAPDACAVIISAGDIAVTLARLGDAESDPCRSSSAPSG